MKRLIILIGNICSGKSTLAKLLENKGYTTYPVDVLKEELNLDNKDYDKNQEFLYNTYAKKIIELSKNKKVIAESTGANKYWIVFYKKMSEHFGNEAISILIDTDKKLCIKRFEKNRTGHRKHTRPALIDFIDKKIKSREISYDISISNNEQLSDFIKKAKFMLEEHVF